MRFALSISTQIYYDSAMALGLDVKSYPDFAILEIKLGGKHYKFCHDVTPFNQVSVRSVLSDKFKVVFMLKRALSPTPSLCVTAKKLAEQSAMIDQLIYPLSIFPPNAIAHRGDIQIDIKNKEDLYQHFQILLKTYQVLVVEPFRPAFNSYRAIIFYGKIIALLELSPPQLTGNGVNTILQLIKIKNKDRIKLMEYSNHGLVDSHPHFLEQLEKLKLTLDTVLDQSASIVVGHHKIPYLGGETKAIAVKSLNKRTIKHIKHIAHFAGLKFAAIDFACEQPHLPINGKNGHITNIILDPDISIFEYPLKGEGVQVARTLIKKLIRSSRWPFSRL